MNWREFQQRQKLARLNGRFLSYVDQGEGEPLVLLHGIPTWGYLWHGYLSRLAEQYRVLVPDMLGYGFSDKSDRFDRSLARQAEAIDAWMASLGISQAAFVAHDIGGGVALRLASLYPERVSALCLINTVCYDSWPIELMVQFGHPAAHRRLSAHAALVLLRRALQTGFASPPDESLLEGLLAPYATEVGKLSLIRDAAALNTNHTTELTAGLSRIMAPACILWGEDDVFQRVAYGERLAWDMPQAQLIRITDARHFVMLDQPDEVLDHISDFLFEYVPPA